MGRPYREEVAQLEDTYRWGLAAEIEPLTAAVGALRARPLVIVGSGGSLSACYFAAKLHETHAQLPARVLTPLEFVGQPTLQDTGVLLLSAGGGNPDILAAAQHAVEEECVEVVGLSTRSGTALGEALATARHAVMLEFQGPAGKDGFLATNSLVLTCVLLARAYGAALPVSLPGATVKLNDWELAGRRSVVAIASGWARAAGADLESKWGESGLGTVTVVDARNFAHGRHHGLSRRASDTALVSLSVGPETQIVERTVRQVPPEMIAGHLATPLLEEAGAIDLLVRVIRLTGAVARVDGLDPGRPHVPQFGRRLYRAGILKQAHRRVADQRDMWIRRKVTNVVWETASEELRKRWRARRDQWASEVSEKPVGGMVLDYDGTLCEATERNGLPGVAVAAALTRFAQSGGALGIATGRGDSVLAALRAILPEQMWTNVILGLYNGAVVLRLDESMPSSSPVDPIIESARSTLETYPALDSLALLRVGSYQIAVRPRAPLPTGLLGRFVREALEGLDLGLDIRCSGHTVDVVRRGATKLNVVRALGDVMPDPSNAIITIGDQGQSGGNDELFLRHPLGLSVELASSRFDSCWNVAPSGARRTTALLSYLNALTMRTGLMYWHPDNVAASAEA